MILQPVAQPLHHRARDEDRAFQRIGRFAVELVGDGAEQPVRLSTSVSPVFRSAKQPVP
jgi:hypothetical protein